MRSMLSRALCIVSIGAVLLGVPVNSPINRQAFACGDTPSSCDTDEDDARYLLKSAIAAVKRDEAEALTWFTQQSHGFRTEDLYVFCIGPGNILDAHPDPRLRGTDASTLTDVTGFRFGAEMIRRARPGEISAITYEWPYLDGEKPHRKHTMFSRVNDQICAVGYYD